MSHYLEESIEESEYVKHSLLLAQTGWPSDAEYHLLRAAVALCQTISDNWPNGPIRDQAETICALYSDLQGADEEF